MYSREHHDERRLIGGSNYGRAQQALWNRVDAFEGIQVKEKVGDPVPLDTFNLEFQGVLPKSESVTGMFGDG